MKKILVFAHQDLWRIVMTNQFVKAAHTMGYEVEVAYSVSDKVRLSGGKYPNIPELAEQRVSVETHLMENLFPHLDSQSTKGEKGQELLTPNQIANRYCGGNIHYVPAMGEDSGSGKAVRKVVDKVQPDLIISLDSYAFFPKSVLGKHDVVGIHPAFMYEVPHAHSTLRTVIRNHDEGLEKHVTGSIHLLGKKVDGGVIISETEHVHYDVDHENQDSLFAIRMKVCEEGTGVLIDMLPEMERYIESAKGNKKDEYEKLPDLDSERLNKYMGESHRVLMQGPEFAEWCRKFRPQQREQGVHPRIAEAEEFAGVGLA